MATAPEIGQRRSYDGHVCTVRYVGEVAGTSGVWLGVEWDDPTRGKHDGSHKGVKYFECNEPRASSPPVHLTGRRRHGMNCEAHRVLGLSKSATPASFVRPSRPSQPPQSFITALHEKYASEVDAGNQPVASRRLIEISGKVVEEVGFDKIRRQLARVEDLRIVILDGMRIGVAVGEGEGAVRETCPRITELDLSHSLFVDFEAPVRICEELRELRSLRLK